MIWGLNSGLTFSKVHAKSFPMVPTFTESVENFVRYVIFLNIFFFLLKMPITRDLRLGAKFT